MKHFYDLMGRIVPSFMTLDCWLEIYKKSLFNRDLKKNTVKKRFNRVGYLSSELGHMPLRSIKPMHIARLIKSIWETGKQNTSRSVLIEARDVFNEAVLAGVLNKNPAAPVKPLPLRVYRQRLTLTQWQSMFEYAKSKNNWKPRMLLLALVTGQRRGDLQKMKFSDIKDGYFFIDQQKTGTRIALPLNLKLEAIGVSLAECIEYCRDCNSSGEHLIRKSSGSPLCTASLSFSFREIFDATINEEYKQRCKPTLHECRSLSERLYRAQGIDTQTLLGHKSQQMTDKYNDERGLNADAYKKLVL